MGNKSGRQSRTARAASEFEQNRHWVKKMKTAFSVLDTDHDHFITLTDIEGPLLHMIDELKVRKEEKDAILDQARQYWIDLVNGGNVPPVDKVSESMFVKNVARAVTTPHIEPKVRALGSTLLFLIDSKKRGYIVKEDFLKIHSADNAEKEHASRLFDSMSRVTKDDYVDAVLFFFTDLISETDPRNLVFGKLRAANAFEQNPHWVKKMKTAFLVLDTNHDGFITLADIEGPILHMIEAFKVPPDEKDVVLDQARRFWIDVVNGGTVPPADKVPESMFVENVARAATTPHFEPEVRALGSTLLFLIDSKKREHIVKEDFLKIYSAYNVEQEHSSRLFESMSGNEGVTKDDYVDAVLFFFRDLTSESDPRNLVFGKLRAANEFERNPHWVKKMKTAFLVQDTDHDGFITLADIERPLLHIIETFKVPPEEKDAILDQARRYWVDLVNGGTVPPADKVSESMFVENVARAVTTPHFEPKVRALGSTLLFLIDSKKRGYIVKEDFLKIYSARDAEKEHASRLFDSMSRVTKDDYVDAVMFFFTDLTSESDPRNLVFGKLRSDS